MIPTEPALQSRADLEWISGKWGELKNRLRKTGGDPNAPRVGGSKEPPSIIDEHVSELMRKITEEASIWGRILIEEAGWVQRRSVRINIGTQKEPIEVEVPGGQMPGLLMDVASQYGHFVTDEDEKVAWDFVDQAAEFRRKVEGVLAGRERARYAGPCPEPGCGGELYARDGIGGTCPECGEPWSPDGQFAYLRAESRSVIMERDVLRAALVSMNYDVPVETIRTWTKRKKIREVEPGLYSFDDALALAKARGERKVSVR